MSTPSLAGKFVRRVSRATTGSQTLRGTLLSSPSSLWFIIFLFSPLLIIVFFGFTTIRYDLTLSYSNLTLVNYLNALDPFGRVFALTLRTVLVALATTAGSLAIGFPVAYFLGRVCPERHRGMLVSFFVIPFWISFVVHVYAILPWVDRNGYIGQALDFVRLGGFADWLFNTFGLGTPSIVPPALIYIWLPFMILPLFTAVLKIDPSLIEAAQDLGAGKWKTFTNVTLPLSYSGVLTGSILIFITAFGSFVEPKILAGKNGILIGNYIQDAFLQFGYLPNGAAAAVVVLVPTIILLYIYTIYAQAGAGEPMRESRVAAFLRWVWDHTFARLPRRTPAVSPTATMGNGGVEKMRIARGPLERAYDRLAARHGRAILWAFTALILIALYVPMAQVVVFSFNHDNNIINWSYFSTRWYVQETRGAAEVRSLFNDADMISALGNSLIIGLIVTAISLVIGILAALAIVRHKFGAKPFLNIMIYTGLSIPSIILGVSLLVFFRILNDAYLWPYIGWRWDFGYSTIIVGHVTFCIPIVVVVLLVSLREFDRSIEEAAMNLGADEFTTFARVTLPNIMPGIVSAALLSFTFSFSELIVTLFLKSGDVNTLPVVFWATLSKHIPTPELNAASTLILGLSIVFVVLANKVQRGGTLYRF